MNYVKVGVLGFFVIFIAILAIQNLGSVDVSFLFWSMSLPKIVLILLTYLLGMITGWGLVEVFKRWVTSA